MNSQQIETFLTIVETESIAHASENLFLSQPTVSYRLKSLETELGFDLFKRSKGLRNVELTLKGQAFVPIAQKYMRLWQDVLMLSATESRLPVSISCPGSLYSHLVKPFRKQITEDTRMFDITINKADNDEIYSNVKSGISDTGFAYERRNDEDLLIEAVFSERLVLAKICTDESEIRAAYHPAELKLEDELYYESCQSFIDWHNTWFGNKSHPYVRINQDNLLAGFFDNTRYWAVVPYSLAISLKKIPGMKIYELLYPPEARNCYRITSRNINEEKRRNVQMFHDCFRTFIQKQHRELNI